jgi:hypothetical protein
MSDTETGQGEATQDLSGFSEAEQAAIKVGQEGFQEPSATPSAPADGRPEYIPEQFWKDGNVDTEGLAKSYASLRSKMDAKRPEDTEADDGKAPVTQDGKINPEAEAEKAAEGSTPEVASVIETVGTNWTTNGEFSEDDYAALEAVGIPKAIADIYVEGLQARAAQAVGELHTFVDGADNYNSMIKWAAGSLSDAEVEAFNTALDNPALRENAVRGLYTRFTSARPNEGKLVTINDGAATGSDVFQSRDELVAAQKDPRYKSDAGYRQSVIDKLTRSQEAGFAAFERKQFTRQIISS